MYLLASSFGLRLSFQLACPPPPEGGGTCACPVYTADPEALSRTSNALVAVGLVYCLNPLISLPVTK
jgi:hypothetical protein